jgi:hypothetical protein
MYQITTKISSTLFCLLTTLTLVSPAIAEDRTFSSPTHFRVCGEDLNFIRPTLEHLTEHYVNGSDRFGINPKNNTRKRNQQLISKVAGKLFTKNSIIYNARSGSYGYDTRILSGEWNSNIEKWTCSDNINNKMRFSPEGDVSLIVLFGYKIKSIEKKSNFYIMTTSSKKEKGLQYIAIDRSLNNRLKIKPLNGEYLDLVDLQGTSDFAVHDKSYLNDGI